MAKTVLTERNLRDIPGDFLRWMKDPISGEGGMRVARIVFNIIGPEFEAARRQFKTNPTGQRILKDRPSLENTVLDVAHLKSLPPEAFGRQVYDFLNNDDYIIPGYLIPGFFMMNGYYDRVQKDEEMDFLLHRFFFAHDLHHVIGGYGPDPCGEALNAMFTAGWSGIISRRLSYLTFFGLAALSMTPKVGRTRWKELLDEAYERGVRTRKSTPLACVYWEELIDKPIEEARAAIGVPSGSLADMSTGDWMRHSRSTETVINSFGKMPLLKKKAKALTEAVDGYGIHWKELLRHHPKTIDKVAVRVMSGPTTKEELMGILAN